MLVFVFVPETTAYEPEDGKELIGQKAPEFEGLEWVNSEPLSISKMRGKVILVRFWLIGCPYCRNTAPALVEFHNKYHEKGLVIIGIHHPKSEKAANIEIVKKQADIYGFEFPVAHDPDWKTLNEFWLNGKDRSFTSSTILIDKEGIIRFVHEGGEYYRSEKNNDANDAFITLDSKISKLLDQ